MTSATGRLEMYAEALESLIKRLDTLEVADAFDPKKSSVE